MYCKNCGRIVDDNSRYCNNCGTRLDGVQGGTDSDDNSNFGFAVLGFFIPLVGLILFLVYESKKPKRAKSAAKGALIGFITEIVLVITLVILNIVFATSIVKSITDDLESDIPVVDDIFHEESTEDILEKYVDVSFGDFEVSDNGYYSETSLDITVKNKADKQCTYHITIEAVDENGARLDTDTIYADRLGAGQEIYLTAFEYVEENKIDKYENATFKVLEINKYDF